jgi:hypothetical protein
MVGFGGQSHLGCFTQFSFPSSPYLNDTIAVDRGSNIGGWYVRLFDPLSCFLGDLSSSKADYQLSVELQPSFHEVGDGKWNCECPG